LARLSKKKESEVNTFEIKKNPDGSLYFEIEFNKKETPLAERDKEVDIKKQCEELIQKFMPLLTNWKFEGNTVNEVESYSGIWSYSNSNKRKAAIKCAIQHCDLIAPYVSVIKIEAIKNKLKELLKEL
jgi:hypothetical protein